MSEAEVEILEEYHSPTPAYRVDIRVTPEGRFEVAHHQWVQEEEDGLIYDLCRWIPSNLMVDTLDEARAAALAFLRAHAGP